MNGVIAKSMGMVLGENGWQWPTESPISLTHDYLIPTANLFRLSPELKRLEQHMFEQAQPESTRSISPARFLFCARTVYQTTQ
jgi:hypothetical protein